MTTTDCLLREDVDGTVILSVNRPEALNALNMEVQTALHQQLDEIEKDSRISVVILTGQGERAFVAGADINELAHRTPIDGLDARMQNLYTRIAEFSKPVIAAINGYAFGGGTELALSCDIRIGSTNAMFALPETGLGIIPSAGATQRLATIVGQGLALDMILTGKRIKAEEANARGIITYLVEPQELREQSLKIAQRIQSKGPLAIKLGRQVIKQGFKADTTTGLMLEKLAQAVIYSTEEKAEGTAAFIEKRSPEFDQVRHDKGRD